MEMMDFVDHTDKVLGQVTQEEIYSKKLTHRIVHVFVINPKTKEIYFQKRAETKSYLPGYYCTSAGGHVRSGETYEQAARRELKEELGLDVPIEYIATMQFEVDNHNRFIQLFIAYADGGIRFDDGEVQSGEFLNIEDARVLVEKNYKIHPQLALCFNYFYRNRDSIFSGN